MVPVRPVPGSVAPRANVARPTGVLRAATAPGPGAIEQVRAMMRAVVTDGTATRLAGLGEVRGKTGTAEYAGDGRAHGWFVGYRAMWRLRYWWSTVDLRRSLWA